MGSELTRSMNTMHLDNSQLYLHPRSLKELANGQWYIVFGEKGAINLEKGLFYQHGSNEVRELISADLQKGGRRRDGRVLPRHSREAQTCRRCDGRGDGRTHGD